MTRVEASAAAYAAARARFRAAAVACLRAREERRAAQHAPRYDAVFFAGATRDGRGLGRPNIRPLDWTLVDAVYGTSFDRGRP